MASVRQTLIQDLFLARLAAIQIADGYVTDAGSHVFFGVTPGFGPDDPPAAIVVVVGDDARVQNPRKVVWAQVPIEVQCLVTIDTSRIAEPGIVIEEMLTDVERAIEQVDEAMAGSDKRSLEVGPVRTLGREPGSTSVGVGITYLLKYARPWGTP